MRSHTHGTANNQRERTTNGDPMKKLAFVFVVLGSGLAALGFSGWHLATSVLFQLAGPDGGMPNSLPDIPGRLDRG